MAKTFLQCLQLGPGGIHFSYSSLASLKFLLEQLGPRSRFFKLFPDGLQLLFRPCKPPGIFAWICRPTEAFLSTSDTLAFEVVNLCVRNRCVRLLGYCQRSGQIGCRDTAQTIHQQVDVQAMLAQYKCCSLPEIPRNP